MLVPYHVDFHGVGIGFDSEVALAWWGFGFEGCGESGRERVGKGEVWFVAERGRV